MGLNPNIRIYRYSKGQYFDCHCTHHPLVTRRLSFAKIQPENLTLADDDSNYLTLDSEPVRTTWTLLLYLTSSADGCVGGETVFYPHDRKSAAEEIVVSLETGMLLLHKHGHDCLLVSRSDRNSRLLPHRIANKLTHDSMREEKFSKERSGC